MSEAWKTRSGDADNSQAREQGDDLASLQRKRGEKRSRPMVEEAANRQAEARRAKLKRKAQLSSLMETLKMPKVWGPILALTAAILLVLALGGKVKDMLNPPLSLSGLQSNSDRLQLVAESRLGAPVYRQKIKESPDNFQVTYRVKAGSKRFRGGRITSPCTLVIEVDRSQSPEQLTGQVISQKGC